MRYRRARSADLVRPDDLPGADARDRAEALAIYVAAIEDPSRPPLQLQWADPGGLSIAYPRPRAT